MAMHRLLAIVACVISLWACSDSKPTDTVESLVADPDRLKDLRSQCKADHARVGDALCNAVAEATRRRFMGGGGPKYTPTPAASAAASAPKE